MEHGKFKLEVVIKMTLCSNKDDIYRLLNIPKYNKENVNGLLMLEKYYFLSTSCCISCKSLPNIDLKN